MSGRRLFARGETQIFIRHPVTKIALVARRRGALTLSARSDYSPPQSDRDGMTQKKNARPTRTLFIALMHEPRPRWH